MIDRSAAFIVPIRYKGQACQYLKTLQILNCLIYEAATITTTIAIAQTIRSGISTEHGWLCVMSKKEQTRTNKTDPKIAVPEIEL